MKRTNLLSKNRSRFFAWILRDENHAKSISYVSLPPPREHLPEIAALEPNLKTHHDFYNFSLQYPDVFWGTVAKNRLLWTKPFDKVQDHDLKNHNYRWFTGGELNVAANCVDRHAEKNPDRIAFIWEKDEPGQQETITYKDLKSLVDRLANVLVARGVQKGDRVTMYMPMSIKLAACMLACARIGAVHNVVFAGFSAEALASRINDAQSETVITADQGIRGGKIIELKQIVDKAKKTCPNVKRVFVMRRTGAPIKMRDNEFCLEKELGRQPDFFPCKSMASEDPLFMLYTSGSTGKPKGLLHTQAGYLLFASLTHKLIFNYNEGDIFGCMADIGWVTGHSYIVYGPLANGATSVIFESTPTYPDAGRYWDVVQRLKITHFYGSPTAYRLLHSFPNDFIKKYDLSSLKVVGSVGEPINQDAWHWLNDNIGKKKCMVLDTWWQTETGGSCIAPSPADTGAPIKPTMAMRPFYGIRPLVLDQEGELVPDSLTVGNLFLGQPWPGMARTIYGDHERYISTYFSQQPGKYFTGDGAHIDIEGHIQIIGRIDDVLNISGHRLGTAEIEDVLDDHPLVAETACIGVPHKIKGESVYAYVSLKQGAEYDESTLIRELKALIKKTIASYAVPEEILIVDAMPKTRSGKIMRRILRKIAVGEKENLGDVSTLSDPNSVDRILRKYEQAKNGGGDANQQKPKILKKIKET